LAFASEISALLALDSVRQVVDEQRLCEYLASATPGFERTFYEGISRLPPAHSLSADTDGCRLERYWTLDPSYDPGYSDLEEWASAFRDVFETAIQSRLRSPETNDTLGTFLSGGIDSSSVACTARHLHSKSMPTYTLAFDGLPGADERRYAEAVVEQGGIDPTFIDGTRLDPLEHLEEALTVHDAPIFGANYFLDREVVRRANTNGDRILLTGCGGDRILSHGERYLADLITEVRPWAFVRELSGRKRLGWPIRHSLWHDVGIPLAPSPLKSLYRELISPYPPSWSHPIVADEFAAEHGIDEHDGWSLSISGHASITDRVHHHRMRHPVLTNSLEALDHLASWHGVELRHPFFDRRVMELCLAVPNDLKSRHGRTREIVRHGLSDLLPDSVRNRYWKSDLSGNFERALCRFGSDEINRLFQFLGPISPYVDFQRLEQARSDLLTEDSPDHSLGDDSAVMIWKAFVADRWFEEHGST
jgi:asparagine synthase (glutamine-hydrolysing)